MNVRNMVTIAIFSALSVVLGLMKIPILPNGGAISLYMVPLIYVAFNYEFKVSFTCCLITAIIEVLLSKYIFGFWQLLLDYIIPMTALSLFAFHNRESKAQLIITIAVVAVIMMTGYVISGILYFGAPFAYSLQYNLIHYVPTYTLNLLIVRLLLKHIKVKYN